MLVSDSRIVAKRLGYKPYLSKGGFDTLKITAEGDLDSNYDWKAYEDSVNDNYENGQLLVTEDKQRLL